MIDLIVGFRSSNPIDTAIFRSFLIGYSAVDHRWCWLCHFLDSRCVKKTEFHFYFEINLFTVGLSDLGASVFIIVLHAIFHQTPNQDAFGLQIEEV